MHFEVDHSLLPALVMVLREGPEFPLFCLCYGRGLSFQLLQRQYCWDGWDIPAEKGLSRKAKGAAEEHSMFLHAKHATLDSLSSFLIRILTQTDQKLTSVSAKGQTLDVHKQKGIIFMMCSCS